MKLNGAKTPTVKLISKITSKPCNILQGFFV